MGLYGMLVVTAAPAATGGKETAAGTAYPGVSYDGEVPILMSEIDPIQNNTVSAAVNTAGFSETTVWSGQPGGCGNSGSSNYLTCYPPAVNYTPLYYMMNGVAFSRANAGASLFPVTPATLSSATGNVLVRVVNAGLRMHVPSIINDTTATTVGGKATTANGFSIIAEDGNRPHGVPKVQSDVFMAAGKTFDLMINAPAAGTTLAIFDRELSLSGNQVNRDAGMLAYIGLGGSTLPAASSLGAAVAAADSYPSLVAGQSLTVSDPSKGVIANDTNVYGVQLLMPPAAGSVTLNHNGTFTYTPGSATVTADTFTYCANGTVTGATCSSGITATVTLGAASIESGSSQSCTITPTFTATTATYLAVKTPGLLAGCSDKLGYPLTLDTASIKAVTGGAHRLCGCQWRLHGDRARHGPVHVHVPDEELAGNGRQLPSRRR